MKKESYPITKRLRDKMIRELYHSGYSNENIHRFMGHKQLSLRTIQIANKLKPEW